MRLSASVLQSAEQRTDPLGRRELVLRSLAVPAVEHLSVTRDQFDVIDLSGNHLSRLENFPRLERLETLHLGGNGIDYVDGRNLRKNCPGLREIVLTGNAVGGWNVVAEIGTGCPKLEFLSLVGNPVARRQHYRLYAIHKIPTLKVLDFQKVKQSERDRARRLASSAAGAAMEADARLEARAAAASAPAAADASALADGEGGGANVFEPGEGRTAEESFATQFTPEERARIREMVAGASSAEEIDRIEGLVRRGILPGSTYGDGGGGGAPPPPPPPPPALPEDAEGEGEEEEGKRQAEGEEGGADAKRHRSE